MPKRRTRRNSSLLMEINRYNINSIVVSFPNEIVPQNIEIQYEKKPVVKQDTQEYQIKTEPFSITPIKTGYDTGSYLLQKFNLVYEHEEKRLAPWLSYKSQHDYFEGNEFAFVSNAYDNVRVTLGGTFEKCNLLSFYNFYYVMQRVLPNEIFMVILKQYVGGHIASHLINRIEEQMGQLIVIVPKRTLSRYHIDHIEYWFYDDALIDYITGVEIKYNDTLIYSKHFDEPQNPHRSGADEKIKINLLTNYCKLEELMGRFLFTIYWHNDRYPRKPDTIVPTFKVNKYICEKGKCIITGEYRDGITLHCKEEKFNIQSFYQLYYVVQKVWPKDILMEILKQYVGGNTGSDSISNAYKKSIGKIIKRLTVN